MKENEKKTNKPGTNKKNPKGNFNPYWIYAILGLLILGSIFLGNPSSNVSNKKIHQEYFLNEILKSNDVKKVIVVNDQKVEVYLKEEAKENEKYTDLEVGSSVFESYDAYFTISSAEQFTKDINDFKKQYSDVRLNIDYDLRKSWADTLLLFAPIILIIVFFLFMMRRMGGGMGGGSQIFNIGKSKATLFDQNAKVQINFKDVAGLDEAKEEVMEIVDFLKDPKKYTNLGGKIPKGGLLIGPPGTGKTLLAKAMAGEAKVPFFSISGSDFVEMFVGVGASRVRDLFKQAREKAPCIIFIDEIDAIGRARGKNVMQGGNDERENTLNQLLVEMDGFSGDTGVIIIAATNRPDVLDSALMRPGRFDRQISIDRPDMKGREAIFKVHLANIKLSDNIDVVKLASQTPGFVGADIANICNEAALVAARKDKKAVEMQDFNDAIDRVVGGLEKKNKIISAEEKEIIAFHEAGHAICGWFLEHAHPLVKVSIVPRGVAALGYAQYLPKEKYLQRTEEILDRMCMTMGGRAAERLIFDKISTGAQSDLDTATKTAYSMVVVYGMNDKIGNVSYYDMLEKNSFQRPYSDDTARVIDEEVKNIIEGQYKRAIELLRTKEPELHQLANALLEKEVLFKDDLEKMFGKRPFEEKDDDTFVSQKAPEVESTSKESNSETIEKDKTTEEVVLNNDVKKDDAPKTNEGE